MLQAVAILALLGSSAKRPVVRAEVNLTQKYLVAGCLDGVPITSRKRRWKLETLPHAVSFTMGDDPRTAGFATVRFTPQVGHKYEIEVRTEPLAFSRRVWKRGTWKPVVRDLTANRIVSGEPEWSDSACAAAAPSAVPGP